MKNKIDKNFLINFENDISSLYEQKKINGPIHLSGNNEIPLIKIFKKIKRGDWVFSTWRNHYHALLKGLKSNDVKKQILNGQSMNTNDFSKNFLHLNSWWNYSNYLGHCFIIKLPKKNKIWLVI